MLTKKPEKIEITISSNSKVTPPNTPKKSIVQSNQAIKQSIKMPTFADCPEMFNDDRANSSTLRKIVVIKRFAQHIKSRLFSQEKIQMMHADGCCGKLTRQYGSYGKVVRCPGAMSWYGCYNCDGTGIQCKGECGDWVGAEGEFCSSSCCGQYYRDSYQERY